MSTLLIALRQLRSAWHAGEIRVLVLALALAVGAMSGVGFFTDRVQSVLSRQGAQLLGGDLAVISDHTLPQALDDKAKAAGLRSARLMEFPSMVLKNEAGRLAEIRAVGPGYPLRGQLTIAPTAFAAGQHARGIPAPGEAWIEPRLAGMLDAHVGDQLAVGDIQLRVSAILQQEPARGGELFSIAPRLLMNIGDVPATGLVQFGSRIRYQTLLAGTPASVGDYRAWLTPRLQRGERMQDVSDARPEIRSALEKSRQFLGLAAMASVILALVAMALAALQFSRRHLDTCALLRCLGASQARILQIFLFQSLLLGVIGSFLGCLLGYGVQAVLAGLAGRLFLETLPSPGWLPAISGFLGGSVVMLGIMLPQLMRLRGVPALRILRRDAEGVVPSALLAWLPGMGLMLALVFWTAQDARLGGIVLAGVGALILLGGLLTWAALLALRTLFSHAGGVWRLGFANLLARRGIGMAQVAGFGLGLMALALLAIVRGDLLESWRASLPADAPNRFIINIQPEQQTAFRDFFRHEHQAVPTLYPMVRGRLVEINGHAIDVARYADERARRLAEREFNLSWTSVLQQDNRITQGAWWRPEDTGKLWLSMEEGIASTLGIRLGDTLTYEIGGRRIALTVHSLRKVEWDSMHANFFAVTPPGVLDGFPVSYITSFYLPAGQEALLDRLVGALPNLTVIDVAAILRQLTGIMDRMAFAIEFVFAFCLLSGLTVLYAALAVSRGERATEAAILRVLGASRAQVRQGIWAEFVGIGLLAGLLAACGASVVAWQLSERVLHIPYHFDMRLVGITLAAGAMLVPAAAWLGLRHLVRTPPKDILLNA